MSCSHIKIHERILYYNSLTAEPDVSTIHGHVEELENRHLHLEDGGSIFILNSGKFNQTTRLHIPGRGNAIYILHINSEETV